MSNAIIYGFKRVGKTTLGSRIAEHLGCPFVDTDALWGRDCRQLYVELGETAFREREKKVVFSLEYVRKSIIATGGGTVLDPENAAFLKTLGCFIYLNFSKETIKSRLFQAPLPAILDASDPIASFEKLYQERSSIYLKIADMIVESEDELWEVILGERFFVLRHGESLMDQPLGQSSMDVPQA